MRPRQRLRRVQRPLKRVVLALVRLLVAAPHLQADLQRLLEPLEPLRDRRERDAEPAGLLFVPARPDAEPGPAAGQHVERGDDLGEDARLPVDHPGDQREQRGPSRCTRPGSRAWCTPRASPSRPARPRGSGRSGPSPRCTRTRRRRRSAPRCQLPPSASGPRGVLKSGICSPTFIVDYLPAPPSHAPPPHRPHPPADPLHHPPADNESCLPGTPRAPGPEVDHCAKLPAPRARGPDHRRGGAGRARRPPAARPRAALTSSCLSSSGLRTGNGSSHGSARIFRRAYPDPLYVRLTGQAGERWRALEAEAGETLLTMTGGIDFGAAAGPGAAARGADRVRRARGAAAGARGEPSAGRSSTSPAWARSFTTRTQAC